MALQHYNSNDLLVRTAVAACAIACKASKIAQKTRHGSATHCDQIGLQIVTHQMACLRCKFELIALPASSQITVTADGGTDVASHITIDGFTVSDTFLYDTDNDTTAAAIADAINNFTSSPNYEATVNGASVTISAVVKDDTANGMVVAIVGGDVTAILPNMTGGQDGVEEEDAIITEAELEAMFNNIADFTGCCYAPLGYGYESASSGVQRVPFTWNTGATIDLNSGGILELNKTK